MTDPFISFLVGMLCGSSFVVGASAAYGMVLRRRRRRELERRSRELVDAFLSAGSPTLVDCSCPACSAEKRRRAEAERKN